MYISIKYIYSRYLPDNTNFVADMKFTLNRYFGDIIMSFSSLSIKDFEFLSEGHGIKECAFN
jgi:hypothetical protein